MKDKLFIVGVILLYGLLLQQFGNSAEQITQQLTLFIACIALGGIIDIKNKLK